MQPLGNTPGRTAPWQSESDTNPPSHPSTRTASDDDNVRLVRDSVARLRAREREANMTSMAPELAGPPSYRNRSAVARTTAPIVFVVADDDHARRSLEQLIKATGFDVEGCGSAEAFMSVPRPRVPCCLLLDSRPLVSGLELQRQVSAQMDMPVVFITGRPDVRLTVQAMKAGAVDVLAEPVNPEQL